MDKGAWWATVHGVAKESNTTEQLSSYRCYTNICAFPVNRLSFLNIIFFRELAFSFNKVLHI